MKRRRPNRRRYCEMCDEWFSSRVLECPDCGAETQLGAADRAYDERSHADAVDSGSGPVLERDR